MAAGLLFGRWVPGIADVLGAITIGSVSLACALEAHSRAHWLAHEHNAASATHARINTVKVHQPHAIQEPPVAAPGSARTAAAVARRARLR